MLPLYKWSGPDEDERQAAVRYWKRAIQVAVELDCRIMNSEFNGRPEAAAASEAQFWRSLEELLPIFEREGMQLRLEPHPDDFIEDGRAAIEMIRGIDNDLVSFLYCAPHTFHQGGDLEGILRYAGPLLTHLHIADSFDHRGSSGLRYILNPPGTPARIHQHLDIGQGEVDWDLFFATLADVGFDGIATVCVFAWEERAADSCRHNLEQVRQLVAKHGRPVREAPMTSTRSRLRLGSCPDSWGVWFADDPTQTPWHRFLDELAEAGYRWLELGPYGYLPTDPARLRDEVERRGLSVSGQAVFGTLHDPAAGSPTCATPTRWPSWSRPWAPATWSCSRATPGPNPPSSTPTAGGPWSSGPSSWAGSSGRSTASRPCSTPTPTATSAPSPRSSGS